MANYSPGLFKVRRDRSKNYNTKAMLGIISGIDIDDDEDIIMLPGSSNAKKCLTDTIGGEKPKIPKKKTQAPRVSRTFSGDKKGKKKDRSLSPPPPEIQAKLDILCDEKTSPLERVTIEIEMNKDHKTRQYLLKSRYERDKKKTLDSHSRLEHEHDEQMADNIRKEAERAKKENEEFEDARQARIKEEKESKMRLKKAKEDARKHAIAQYAKDAEELRKTAERAKKVQAKNIEKRQKEREEHEAYKEKVLAGENDVMRALKAAMIDQKGPSKR